MRSLIAAGSVVLALWLTAAAEAKFPTFPTTAIVPGQSIGGVSIGMTKPQAAARWGRFENCFVYRGITTCEFRALSTLPSGLKLDNPYVQVTLKASRIVAIEVEFAENAALDPKLQRLKTSKNVRLGSNLPAARTKYRIRLTGRGEANESHALLKSPGNRCTQFYAPDKPYTRITSITVGICKSVSLLL